MEEVPFVLDKEHQGLVCQIKGKHHFVEEVDRTTNRYILTCTVCGESTMSAEALGYHSLYKL